MSEMSVRAKIVAAVLGAVILGLLATPGWALVEIRLAAAGGEAEMERNSAYTVNFLLTPEQAGEISQVYAYFIYDGRVFENLAITDRMVQHTAIVWETDYVNPQFDSEGDYVTAQYLKANVTGDNWLVSPRQYNVYSVSFKVAKDAPLGWTNLNFTANATISDQGGGDITGSIHNLTVQIVEDKTPPVTTAAPPGGYYGSAVQVSLSINEAGTIYYSASDSNPDTVYVSPVSITGEAGTLTSTTLAFRGVDEPHSAAPNWEPVRFETYHIDREPPEVHNLAASPEVIGLGGVVGVTFEVSDLSGVLGNNGYPDYVRLGGRGMIRVSGSDTGAYLYRREITGEESDGTVEIKVTDAAGNTAFHTGTDLVGYDLDGPTFVVTPDPDPVYLQRLLKIYVEASEPLLENPEVTVGGRPAGFFSSEGLNYEYTYLVEGRDWEAAFEFLRAEDSDGDGLPDWWEDEFGLNPFSAMGNDGAEGDPDGDGWTNLAEYRFYQMTGRLVDPKNPNSGGQAIPLHRGWNLISYTVNTCWYDSSLGTPSNLLAGLNYQQISDGNWSDFYNASRFKDRVTNFIASMARHPDLAWTYFGYNQPSYQNTLDYKSPDEGLWINMGTEDMLILEGPRVVPAADNYPAVNIRPGWNLVGILPQTMFYVEGAHPGDIGPSDRLYERGYPSVNDMIKAAFNLTDGQFARVKGIQILYPAPYGVRAYDSSLPWFFQSLKFVLPGFGVWLKLDDGEIIELRYRDPE